MLFLFVCVFRGVTLQLSIFHFNNQVLRKINIAVESEGQKVKVKNWVYISLR